MSSRFGVRSRLLLSYVGISGFAVLAAVAAMYSFAEVRKALEKITEQRVPAALVAQELSARAERIVAGTPALIAATTTHDHLNAWDNLNKEVDLIDLSISKFSKIKLPANVLIFLQNVLDPLRSNLFSLNELIGERIMVAGRKELILENIKKAYERRQALLGVWIANVSASIDESGYSTTEGLVAKIDLITSVTLLQSLQQVQNRINEVEQSLLGMTSSGDIDRIEELKSRAERSIEILGTLAAEVGTDREENIRAEINQFRQNLEGENGIPALRTQ